MWVNITGLRLSTTVSTLLPIFLRIPKMVLITGIPSASFPMINSQLLSTEITSTSTSFCSCLHQWLVYVHPSHFYYWSLLGYWIKFYWLHSFHCYYWFLLGYWVPMKRPCLYGLQSFEIALFSSHVCNCLHQWFSFIKLIIPTSRVMTLSKRSKRSGICVVFRFLASDKIQPNWHHAFLNDGENITILRWFFIPAMGFGSLSDSSQSFVICMQRN